MFNKGDIVVCNRNIPMTNNVVIPENSLHILYENNFVCYGDTYCSIVAPEPIKYRHFLECDFQKLKVGDTLKSKTTGHLWVYWGKSHCIAFRHEVISSCDRKAVYTEKELLEYFELFNPTPAPVKEESFKDKCRKLSESLSLSREPKFSIGVELNIKEPKFKVGDVVRCIKDDELSVYRIYYEELYQIVSSPMTNSELFNLNNKHKYTQQAYVNGHEDCFELVSRVIDGVTYTKEEIEILTAGKKVLKEVT